MLRASGKHVGDYCGERPPDWTRGARGCLIWGIPAGILFASSSIEGDLLVIVWPPVLTFMGVACLLNARRCGRVHCYVTGPFFLLLAGLSLLYGLGMLRLGAHGWSILSAVLLLGSAVLICVPERLFGRYRPSSNAPTG